MATRLERAIKARNDIDFFSLNIDPMLALQAVEAETLKELEDALRDIERATEAAHRWLRLRAGAE